MEDDLDSVNIRLKAAREQLTLRQIRNEDLKLAVAEGKLIPIEVHRSSLNEIVTTTVTFLETLPDVVERQLALPGPIVDSLRKAVDGARDNLYEKLFLPAKTESVPASEPLVVPKKRGRPTNAEREARMRASNAN